jgi:uncharacterized protein (TIGR02444 family)
MESLWRFSLRVYARPGVERAVLALQESCGVDVNLLFFCCWLGGAGRKVDRRLLKRATGAVSGWRREVIAPLRNARRRLKLGISGVPTEWSDRLRKGIGKAELDAEQVEQILLERCAGAARPGKEPPETIAAENLDRYLGLLGSPADGAKNAHCRTLLAAALPASEPCARRGFAP